MKKFISFFTTVVLLAGGLGLLPQNAAAQTKVTGTIVDASGIGIPGATVIQAGTNNGAVADIDGNFEINVPQGADLQISCIGYETVTVKATGSPLNIVLQDDTNLLEEVVVTGYGGTQRRAKLTNSIAKVDEQTFAVGAHTNPASALSGAVSGLRVIQSSGNPNAVPQIILRGGTNLDGSGSPLVVIDGQLRDSMEDINSEDIESMEVLKDAGATALYGARASNGVILITTKSGKEGRREINFKAKYGLNYMYLPWEFEDAGDYIYWMRKAYNESHWAAKTSLSGVAAYGIGATELSPSTVWNVLKKTNDNAYLLQKGWQEMVDPLDPSVGILYKDTRPADYNINTPATSQDYNVNMSGGNDRGSYYSGIGYNATDGLAQTTYYKRLSFLFNASYKITDWLTSKSSVNFSRTKYRSMTATNSNESSYFGRIMSTPPTVRFEDEDGNMLLGNSTGDGNQNFQNDKFLRDYENDKLTLTQGFSAKLLPGLTANVNANWYYNEDVNESFNKDYKTNQAGTSVNTTRSSSAAFYRYFTQTYNATLNYDKDFLGENHIDVMVGTEYYDRAYKAFTASGSLAPTDDFQKLGLTTTDAGKRDIDSAHSQYRILSYFGRVNYDYAGKYLLSATFREDGYSALLDNRWGFFPGVSAGWVFGKENFVREAMPWLSFGKFRMSYGVNGNASGIGAYELQGSYSSLKYNGQSGFYINVLPNPSLRWERTNTFETGIDVSFLDNKLNANITYYNRLTDDKYASLALPSTTGYSSVKNNNGKLRNKGLEFELSAKVLQKKDLRWDLKANISYNKNIIVALPDNGVERNRQGGSEIYTGNGTETVWVGGYQEGQEPGSIIGYVAEYIFRSESDFPTNYVVQSGQYNGKYQYTPADFAKLTPAQQNNAICLAVGDIKWKDMNNDGVIDSKDRKVLGNTTPHWTGGFTSNLTWKNLRFYAAFDYALGFYTYNSGSNDFTWFLGCMQGTYNMPTQVWDTVSKDNPNGKYPRYVWADQLGPANYYRINSMFTYRGDYLAVRELSLSYSLPKNWVNAIKAQKLELSVTGQNLGYLSAAMVSNHEVGGSNTSNYPLPRTLLLGVNLTF
ncbi:MAG: TonB-dependent receptor [Bacteroidales bacterium]|nr:TonB-dependent receptor [Bacteroidales bacterium]